MDTKKLFSILKGENEFLNTGSILSKLNEYGIIENDPRIQLLVNRLQGFNQNYEKDINNTVLDYDKFEKIVDGNIFFINQIFSKELIIDDFEKMKKEIQEIYSKIIETRSGEVASYIPQLKNVDPEKLGISLCTISGQRFSVGDVNDYFCVQSTCKPINYLISLEDFSPEEIHTYVGKEPSGSRFNALMLNEDGKPHNPLINAGAIMTCSLVKKHLENTPGERFESITNSWNKACGNIKKVGFSNATYLSERKTADRNFALAYFMRETTDNKKIGFPENTNIIDILELYFQCCSIEITCEMMSIVAATLANGGKEIIL